MAIRPPALSPSSVIGWGHSGVAAIAASVHADVEIERAIMALQQVPWHMIIAIIVPSPIKSEAGTSRRRARLGARLRPRFSVRGEVGPAGRIPLGCTEEKWSADTESAGSASGPHVYQKGGHHIGIVFGAPRI